MSSAVRAAGLDPAHAVIAAGWPPEPATQPDDPTAEHWQRVLALRVRAVAEANNDGDRRLLLEALNDLSAAAFGWADHLETRR